MSDHYKYVAKRVEKMESPDATGQQDYEHNDDDNAADNIRASCDRRLSRAAREIVKQKLVQALVDAKTTTTTIISPTSVDAAAASASVEMSDLSINSERRSKHHPTTLQDILASDNPAKFSVWELLENVVAANSKTTNDDSSSTCWLYGQRDVLRYHEEHVSTIPVDLQGRRGIDTPTANRRHVNQKLLYPHWYQCLLCRKVFSSRFYLDRHFENHHKPPPPPKTQLSKDSTTSRHDDVNTTPFWICPATDWCGHFISLSACHEMALTLEPHYGPGSQGRRITDRFHIENQLWKEAHAQPCTTSGMQTATTTCHNMIQSCFFHQQQQPAESESKENNNNADVLFTISQRIGQVLDNSLCSSLSCPDRLHRLFFKTKTGGDLVMRHVHEWEEEWIYWTKEHHEMGWVGLILLLVLAVWYANALLEYYLLPLFPRARALVPAYFRPGGNNKRKIPKAQGSRLIRKSPSKTSTVRGNKIKEN